VTQAPQVLAKSAAELFASKGKDAEKRRRNDQLRYAIQRCLTTDDMAVFVGYVTRVPMPHSELRPRG
jgi:hypothetical protein